ncbi:MAG: 50S ribosomal protein L18 [Chlamydiia bacterium]|nr:50S ribosomal protein L18 [Chlamydiia bacterium]MCH9616564.1 50S ribosomal protein L18 [Chlamydiia bacterium]MCH9629294.1 50S ribosomal protein L18 [Chlamydiia bacterium]
MHSKKTKLREKRTLRVRRRLKMHNTKPRLAVFKSNKNFAAQLIDDEKGITLVGGVMKKSDVKTLGKQIAEKAKEKGVETVVFDRGCFKYHGLVAAFADSAREAGLKF